jgi:crotonobetaine/carnitine-CoA ligase
VLKPGHTLTPAEVRDWCRERLAALKIPRFVVFVDEIPHTATHKIAKAMLKKDETLVGRADDAQAGKAKTAAKPGE